MNADNGKAKTEYPPMSPELRAVYDKHSRGDATEDDLIRMATDQSERAMLSTPPHCLPTKGGLPHNEDHANACAHRCWAFLCELAARRKNSTDHQGAPSPTPYGSGRAPCN